MVRRVCIKCITGMLPPGRFTAPRARYRLSRLIFACDSSSDPGSGAHPEYVQAPPLWPAHRRRAGFSEQDHLPAGPVNCSRHDIPAERDTFTARTRPAGDRSLALAPPLRRITPLLALCCGLPLVAACTATPAQNPAFYQPNYDPDAVGHVPYGAPPGRYYVRILRQAVQAF